MEKTEGIVECPHCKGTGECRQGTKILGIERSCDHCITDCVTKPKNTFSIIPCQYCYRKGFIFIGKKNGNGNKNNQKKPTNYRNNKGGKGNG